MSVNYRDFNAGPDLFGETWQVEFVWLQTAVSIRGADAVDVKFFLTNGIKKLEKVIALSHPDLLALSRREARPLTDPWCMKLAALHLKYMVETGADMEKTLVSAPMAQLDRYATLLEEAAPPRVR